MWTPGRHLQRREQVKEVLTFKYLGSIISATGSLLPDISKKVASVRASFARIRNTLKILGKHDRLRLVGVFVLPVPLYAIDAIDEFTTAEWSRLNSTYVHIYRRATRLMAFKTDEGDIRWVSERRVLLSAGVPDLKSLWEERKAKLAEDFPEPQILGMTVIARRSKPGTNESSPPPG